MIEQLAFGYEEGHRLLAGSRPVDSGMMSALLGATDATVADVDDRLLTGLSFPRQRLYAFSVTWAAPEVPRPGAVWAHVLLVSTDLLGTLPDPFALINLVRKPSVENLGLFEHPIDDHVAPGPSPDVPMALFERAVASAYGAHSVVLAPNLADGEACIARLWAAQWPDLRGRFSFRTRDSVRESSQGADLVVSRRIRGRRRATQGGPDRWAQELARDLLHVKQSGAWSFVVEFGPLEVASPSNVGELAQIFETVEAASADEVRAALEQRYPDPLTGVPLKAELLGRDPQRWWQEREPARVGALLRARVDAWDFDRLQLAERLTKQLQAEGGRWLASELPAKPIAAVLDSTIEALLACSDPADLAVLARDRLPIVHEVLQRQTSLSETPQLWRELRSEDATALLGLPPEPSDGAVLAAVAGEKGAEVIRAVGAQRVVRLMADRKLVSGAEQSLTIADWQLIDLTGEADDVLLLSAAARNGPAPTSAVVGALERERSEPDETWLRAAVRVLASPQLPPAEVLPTLFGPLHAAMTSDLLPRDCWEELELVLPSAPDPALRLRRMLVAEARTNNWTADEFKSALRDAGPYAPELLREFEGPEDWWTAALRNAFRSLGLRHDD